MKRLFVNADYSFHGRMRQQEAWLGEMSRQGMHLKEPGFFGSFLFVKRPAREYCLSPGLQPEQAGGGLPPTHPGCGLGAPRVRAVAGTTGVKRYRAGRFLSCSRIRNQRSRSTNGCSLVMSPPTPGRVGCVYHRRRHVQAISGQASLVVYHSLHQPVHGVDRIRGYQRDQDPDAHQ